MTVSKLAREGVHNPKVGFALSTMKEMLLKYGRGAYSENFKNLWKNRVLCGFFAASATSFGYLACKEMLRLFKVQSKTKTAKGQGSKSGPASKKKRKNKVSANRKFWHTLGRLAKIALPSLACKGSLLLTSQFFLLIMRTLLTVTAVKTNSYFLTKAISTASWKYWYKWVSAFSLWMGASIIVNSGLRWTENQIALELRLRLTQHAHKMYMQCNNFYRLGVLKQGQLDNLDGRITSDIDKFSANAAQLYGHSFKPILEFFLSLWVASKDLGMKRPIALFSWHILSNFLFSQFAPSQGRMVVQQQILEGDFRRAHSRLITRGEEVAFLRGSNTEKLILDQRLQTLADTRATHNLQNIRKSVVSNIMKFQGMLVGGMFVHVPFLVRTDLSQADRISQFRGTEELMLKCGGAMIEILGLGLHLQELAGYTHRIGELMDALEEGFRDAQQQTDNKQVKEGAEAMLVFRSVTITAPGAEGRGRTLIRELNLDVQPGQSIMVTGPNGAGKTSLFRVLAGLWKPNGGFVLAPTCPLMWLPQNPYLVMGTLRDQVAYPDRLGFDTSRDEEVMRCLELAGLGVLYKSAEGLGLVHDEWEEILSGGERQRMGFARLFYHRPSLAVLDESTSAINPEGEHELYRATLAAGVTVFSIAHRLQLRQYHRYELYIQGDGSGDWRLTPLESSPPP